MTKNKIIRATDFAKNTINPLRKIWEESTVEPNPELKSITLQIGDPTAFGNFPPSSVCIQALRSAIEVDTFSYYPSAGTNAAREAVTKYVEHINNECVNIDDVILTSGCSMALEMCFRVLASAGENILVPRPCWNYTTWILGLGIEVKFYNLDPSKGCGWEIDLNHMESLINENTKAILINSPGNPCGNVFSKEHILEILKIAERHQLPIISDEIYEHFVFPGVDYHSISSLSKNVPVLTCSGLTKRFLMPGIRMGWILIHDRNSVLSEIKRGLFNISSRHFGPNSTVMLALPSILNDTPKSFFQKNNECVAKHAKLAHDILKSAPGLNPVMPRGAMYMMIAIDLSHFPKYSTCLEFIQQLIREQSVLTFPGGSCFYYPDYLRIVLTVPEDLLMESCNRIKKFCQQNFSNN